MDGPPESAYGELEAWSVRHFGRTAAEVEKLALHFITIEIEAGLTFARLANADFDRGDCESGARMRVNAFKACAEADRFMQRARNGNLTVQVLEQRLSELRETLSRLDSRALHAARQQGH